MFNFSLFLYPLNQKVFVDNLQNGFISLVNTFTKVSNFILNRVCIILFTLCSIQSISQIAEYGQPEKLPASINADADTGMPLLSSDGKLLFFTRFMHSKNIRGKYSGHDIWTSVRAGKDWLPADNQTFQFNNQNNNAVIGTNASGDVLYLMDASSSKKVDGVYFTKLMNNRWSKPELIRIPGIESNGFISFYMSPDFDVIFISMKGLDSKGEEDIYVSIKENTGEWSKPKNLGSSINTKGFETSPFLTKDKKKLYFSSDGHAGFGDADVFVSERLYGSWDVWSVPQNLGKPINSEKFDAYFSMYGDSICFFSSNRENSFASVFKSRIIIDDGKKQKERIDSILNETKGILEEVRKNSIASHDFGSDKILISYEDGTSTLESESNKVLKGYLEYLKNNPAAKLKIEFDGKLVETSKSLQLTNQNRVRLIKQMVKSLGITESRVLVSPTLFSTESSRSRLNSFQLSIQ